MSSPRGAYDALLFDLDGTLVDSMPLHQRAWVRWFASIGEPLDEDPRFFATTAGRSIAEILADMYPHKPQAEREAMADAKEAMYRVEAAQHLQAVDGALALLARARAQGMKIAVCTAAPLANIQVSFERFGLHPLVDAVTSPADGLRGKPHPDIFEEAARRLGAEPARCLVFEDAPLGIEAARRAGMAAVAITTTLSADAFSAYPNLITAVSDFTALDPSLLFA